MTTREFAEKYGVSVRRVQVLIKQGRIKAQANPDDGYWIIPDSEQYPPDARMSWMTRHMEREKQRKPRE